MERRCSCVRPCVSPSPILRPFALILLWFRPGLERRHYTPRKSSLERAFEMAFFLLDMVVVPILPNY